MFDIGWSEILVVAIVLVVVVGPKDLPRMLRAFGRTTSKLRAQAGEFRRNFDEALKEAELDGVKDLIDDARSLDPRNDIKKALNPLRAAGDEIKASIENAGNSITAAGSDEVVSVEAPETTAMPLADSPVPASVDELGSGMQGDAEAPAAEPAAPRKKRTTKATPAKSSTKKSASATRKTPSTAKKAAASNGAAKPAAGKTSAAKPRSAAGKTSAKSTAAPKKTATRRRTTGKAATTGKTGGAVDTGSK